jgi:AbrB family looped-hinge helix DNA binding protein
MARPTTNISTKGQVVLPKALRDALGWRPGDKLVVEKQATRLVLSRADEGGHTRIEDVAGCLGPAERVVSIEEMNHGIGKYVRKHWGHEYDDLD